VQNAPILPPGEKAEELLGRLLDGAAGDAGDAPGVRIRQGHEDHGEKDERDSDAFHAAALEQFPCSPPLP